MKEHPVDEETDKGYPPKMAQSNSAPSASSASLTSGKVLLVSSA